jgi:uncharacterized membrane protein YkvA (DUF1232 family)
MVMKIFENIKAKAKNLKKEIIVIYYAYQNPETGLLPKVIILFTLGYALSPIDLIPDFIPVLGYLDDLIIIPALIALSIKLIPQKIMDEAREKASKEPLKLRDNWLFAFLFILTWIILAVIMILSAYKLVQH